MEVKITFTTMKCIVEAIEPLIILFIKACITNENINNVVHDYLDHHATSYHNWAHNWRCEDG